jgi:large subunit ribosomal protein L25
MKIEFTAFPRTAQGTGASRRLRGGGKVPGIVYGADKPAMAIELDHQALYRHLKMETFHASILDMTLEGAKQQVLLRDVQMHPFRPLVLHVDFQRVDKNQKIHMKVPLHFINAEICPGVKVGGGVVNHVMNEIDIQCLPADLPEFIEVNLEKLELGHSIHLNEVPLPQGIELISRLKKENPAIVTAQVPKAIVIEEEVAAPVTEIIGEVPAEGEEAAAAEGKEGEKTDKGDKGDKADKKEAAADKKEAGKKEAGRKE